MTDHTKILTFADITREDSTNKKLAKLANEEIKSQGIAATYLDLKDYPLPVYDGDDELQKGLPENAKKLKQYFLDHDGIFISCPEYNSSITAVLKNTIDWISRSEQAGGDLTAFTGKIIAISSAAPGKLGGLRGLVHVRSILSNLGCIVIPNQLAIHSAFSAFDDAGKLKDEAQAQQFKDVVATLVDTAKRYKIDLHSYCKTLFNDLSFKN